MVQQAQIDHPDTVNMSHLTDRKELTRHFFNTFSKSHFFSCFFWAKDLVDYDGSAREGKWFIRRKYLQG